MRKSRIETWDGQAIKHWCVIHGSVRDAWTEQAVISARQESGLKYLERQIVTEKWIGVETKDRKIMARDHRWTKGYSGWRTGQTGRGQKEGWIGRGAICKGQGEIGYCGRRGIIVAMVWS